MWIAKLALACLAAGLPAAASAQVAGTQEQAKALIDTAVAHYHEVGRTQALADFSDKQGAYFHNDLYVFCFGPDHKMTMQAASPGLAGKDISIFKDPSGAPFLEDGWKQVTANGQAVIDYSWVNPATKKIAPKSTFLRMVSDQEACGVGYYK